MARLKGIAGVTLEPLYDQLCLPSAVNAGVDVYTWFTLTKGQHDPNDSSATRVKSYVDTNLTGGGQRLPVPEEFSVLGIALCPEFAANSSDVVTVYNKSWFEFHGTGNSVPFRCPTRFMTAGTGINRTDSSSSVVGVPLPGAIISFPDEHALEIFNGEQFYAAIDFDASQTLGGASAIIRTMLCLWGLHKKGVATT